MPRAEPFMRVGEHRDAAGRRGAHAGDQQGRLAVEQLQHLAFQAAVAERGAGEMDEIDRPVVGRERGCVLESMVRKISNCMVAVPWSSPACPAVVDRNWHGGRQGRVNAGAGLPVS